MKDLLKLSGFEISYHEKSNRVINIKIEDEIIDRLAFPFKKFNITALEYKPFTRFTIAKSLDETASNKLSNFLNEIIKDRETGCFIIGPKNISSKIDQPFLIKLSTAITHLIGNPNHDSMAGKYYARFHVKHEDNSDSYLRKAYINMDLHTDGTYVRETTDWILMSKLEEEHVVGGETALLHLDDWEHLPELSEDKDGKPIISYIDQFPEPKNMEQGLFLQKLSDALEGSKNKILTSLPVGSAVVANNYFWLHGRKPFVENKNLSRELLRIRGSFFNN
jgi:protein CsiD